MEVCARAIDSLLVKTFFFRHNIAQCRLKKITCKYFGDVKTEVQPVYVLYTVIADTCKEISELVQERRVPKYITTLHPLPNRKHQNLVHEVSSS